MATVEYETIRLHDMQGFARKSGTDDSGSEWIEFESDAFADQLPGKCDICSDEIYSGWLCLDGGDEVCDSHIDYD